MFAATDNVLKNNCLTENGQYGFQSAQTIQGDALTGGPYNVWIESNEISYNDTCDLSGLLDNAALGWKQPQPRPGRVPRPALRGGHGDGNQGGFKLWGTNGVMIRNNWIHHNWGVGGWADTNNANTTWTGNTITDNENGGDLGGDLVQLLDHRTTTSPGTTSPTGRATPGFPMPAIYISESGQRLQERRRSARAAMPSCVALRIPGHPRPFAHHKATPSSTTAAASSSGRTPTATAATASTGSAPLVQGRPKGPFSKGGCA